jgi:hypothetical protein
MMVFDYMRSDGHRLDTPAGVEGRRETIALLQEQREIVHPRPGLRGDFQSLTAGVKRR